MSSDLIDNNDLDFVEEEFGEGWETVDPDARLLSDEEVEANVELIHQAPEKKYSVDSSQQFSQFLSKDISSRYQAIVLNSWAGEYDSSNYEVGLVHKDNYDHRNGVVRALRVSPFHVNFVSLDEAFFEYMHSHI